MIGFALCILALAVTAGATRRSLGHGISAVVAFGYFYGLIRARFPDGGSHFVFDSAILGFYAVHFSQPPSVETQVVSARARAWVMALCIWPVVCMGISLGLPDSQPMIVQLVGLRAAAMYVPFVLIGARVKADDLGRLATALALLNLAALAAGLYEYVFGVEALVPRNHMTELLYATRDIKAGGEFHLRIPSTFVSSAGWGAAAGLSLPFLVQGLEGGRGVKLFCLAGMAAAGISVFMCGSRTAVVLLLLSTGYVLVTMRARMSTLLTVAFVGACVAYVVLHNERFQRFETLADTDFVEERIAQSVNVSFLDAMLTYPIGAGLASAFGTSIPFFLASQARPPVGIENEYGRIVIEQGIIGLALWLGFIASTLVRRNSATVLTESARSFALVYLFVSFASASTGVGLLVGVPTTAMILLLAGMRQAVPIEAKAAKALRNVPRGRRSMPVTTGITTAPLSGLPQSDPRRPLPS